MLAGMIIRPRATSSRISSGASFSRRAIYSISSVIRPLRAKCIWEKFPPGFCALRAAIHSARGRGTLCPLLPLLGVPFVEAMDCAILEESYFEAAIIRWAWERDLVPRPVPHFWRPYALGVFQHATGKTPEPQRTR